MQGQLIIDLLCLQLITFKFKSSVFYIASIFAFIEFLGYLVVSIFYV